MTASALHEADLTLRLTVRRAGRLCLWAGLLGAASGVLLAIIPPAVASDRYSYPLAPMGFVAIQLWFAVQHLGLLAGILGLVRVGVVGDRRRGAWTAATGMSLLTLTELAAIAAAWSPYPSPGTRVLDVLYGISVVAIGAGLIAAGIAVVRAQGPGFTRETRSKWLLLATGVYAFVPMMPLMATGFLGARLAITGWMLLFAAVGWLLVRVSGGATPRTARSHRRRRR